MASHGRYGHYYYSAFNSSFFYLQGHPQVYMGEHGAPGFLD